MAVHIPNHHNGDLELCRASCCSCNGSALNRRQNAGSTFDFISARRWKIHELAGLGVLAGSRHHFVQFSTRFGIHLHLPIPIVVRPGVKQCLQLQRSCGESFSFALLISATVLMAQS